MPEPQLVPIARFFDGNDDLSSIGCNLDPHPGIEAFRNLFLGLLSHPDVESVYAQIAEADPGEDSWPFSDTVLVVGRIPMEEVRRAVSVLTPDEVGQPEKEDLMSPVLVQHGCPVVAIWWD